MDYKYIFNSRITIFESQLLKIATLKNYNSEITTPKLQFSNYNSQTTILELQFSNHNSRITILELQFSNYNLLKNKDKKNAPLNEASDF